MAGGGRKPSSNHPIDLPSSQVSFDPDAFNEFLNVQGVRLVHYKAMRCPVGMTDVDDNRRPHDDHEGCSNGFIYFKAGIVTAGIGGNGNEQISHDLGLLENSTFVATFPQHYDGTVEPIAIAKFDRFYLDESEPEAKILVPTWHLQTTHGSRSDKLYYPAESVEKLVDYRGIEYVEHQDFCLEKGNIKWNGSKWPGYQLDVKRGAIYSVRYHYRPYWYCARMLHEIRVAQVETFEGRVLKRLPQQCLLAREYTFTNQQRDSEAKDAATTLRQTPEPNDGGWGGPR